MTPQTRAWLAAPLVALTLCHPPLVRAQTTPPPASAALDLSASQQSRIDARQAQFQKELAALTADAALSVPQKQAKYIAMRQAMNGDIMAILTPAQRAQEMKRQSIHAQFQKDAATLGADKSLTEAQKRTRYIALVRAADVQTLATMTAAQRALAQKQRQAALTQQQAQQALVANATRMGKEIQASLSPAQTKRIGVIGSASGAQVQALIADKSVSEQAKVAKIAAIRRLAQSRINEVLTPAQRAKYAALQQMVSGSAR